MNNNNTTYYNIIIPAVSGLAAPVCAVLVADDAPPAMCT